MDYLLICRHGAYAEVSLNITIQGKTQIQALILKVKTILSEKTNKISVVTSITQRAKQSAEIIAVQLSLSLEEVLVSDALFSDGEILTQKTRRKTR